MASPGIDELLDEAPAAKRPRLDPGPIASGAEEEKAGNATAAQMLDLGVQIYLDPRIPGLGRLNSRDSAYPTESMPVGLEAVAVPEAPSPPAHEALVDIVPTDSIDMEEAEAVDQPSTSNQTTESNVEVPPITADAVGKQGRGGDVDLDAKEDTGAKEAGVKAQDEDIEMLETDVVWLSTGEATVGKEYTGAEEDTGDKEAGVNPQDEDFEAIETNVEGSSISENTGGKEDTGAKEYTSEKEMDIISQDNEVNLIEHNVEDPSTSEDTGEKVYKGTEEDTSEKQLAVIAQDEDVKMLEINVEGSSIGEDTGRNEDTSEKEDGKGDAGENEAVVKAQQENIREEADTAQNTGSPSAMILDSDPNIGADPSSLASSLEVEQSTSLNGMVEASHQPPMSSQIKGTPIDRPSVSEETAEDGPAINAQIEDLSGEKDIVRNANKPVSMTMDSDSPAGAEPAFSGTTEEGEQPSLFSTLEASLNNPQPAHIQLSNVNDKALANGEPQMNGDAFPEVTTDEHPEWEVDSSPIGSSDDSSSEESSSESDSEDEEKAYKLLSPEEQARILMEGDGGSDDEGGGKGVKGSGGQLRTKNEIPEEIIPKPDVIVTPDMRIEELGHAEAIVENSILIKAKISGEYKVLDSGSVLCLEDRSVIGVVSETLGQVQQPYYSVRFTKTTDITEAGLSIGTKIFYSEHHTTYVFTQALKSFKGSDASNLHDEEVGDEEVEFSDDEAEAEHKRQLKQKRIERRGGRMQQNGGHPHAHPLRQETKAYDPSVGISYDDVEDDGPYKPLARPIGYAEHVGRTEAPQEGGSYGQRSPDASNDHFRGGRGRGRGDRGRGRGRGNRGRGDGRGRGHSHAHPSHNQPNGYSLPPSNSGHYPPALSTPQANSYPLTPQTNSPMTPSNGYYSNISPGGHYPSQQPPMWPPQYQPHQAYQKPYPQQWQGSPPMSSLPAGAYINPAFFQGSPPPFPTQWNQHGQQGSRGDGGTGGGGQY